MKIYQEEKEKKLLVFWVIRWKMSRIETLDLLLNQIRKYKKIRSFICDSREK